MKKSDYEALAAFRYALRRFVRFSEQAALSVNLTPQQHQAMLAIRGFPGRDYLNISELAERLQLRHHSVVGLVDRLVTQGMVNREHSKDDKRVVFISLTPRGEEMLERLTEAHRDEIRRVVPEMTRLLQSLPQGGETQPAPKRKKPGGD
ncbi:MAG TPA: MarR family transcriptional regulator [Armatimonadota bacterium]|nr:MarR family transcriptional regulator [Armatimonadota bacterium]